MKSAALGKDPKVCSASRVAKGPPRGLERVGEVDAGADEQFRSGGDKAKREVVEELECTLGAARRSDLGAEPFDDEARKRN